MKGPSDLTNANDSQENLQQDASHSYNNPAAGSAAKQMQNKVLKKYFFRQSMPFCHYSGHNLWILKATKLNQGQGIHVCNNLAQVKSLIQKYCEGFPKKQLDNFTYEREVKPDKKDSGVELGHLGSGGGYASSDSKRTSQVEFKGRTKGQALSIKMSGAKSKHASDIKVDKCKRKQDSIEFDTALKEVD